MRIWSFIFTQADSPIRMARVAAPIGDWADSLLIEKLGEELVRSEGVIRQYVGQEDNHPVGVISVTTNKGEFIPGEAIT